MQSSLSHRASLFCCITLMLIQQSAHAQTSQPANELFRLQLSTGNANVRQMIVGRSVPFELRFYNGSDKPFYIPWGSTLYDDMFEFAMVGPDGQLLSGPAERSAPPVLSGATEFVRVPPGGIVAFVIALGSAGKNGQQWYFRKPGEYAIRATYHAERDRYFLADGKAVTVENPWTGTLQAPMIRFTLGPATSLPLTGTTNLEGQVVDWQGKPVEGAEVIATGVGVGRSSTDEALLRERLIQLGGDVDISSVSTNLADRAITDPDGHFSIDSLPNDINRYSLRVRHPRYPAGSIDVPIGSPVDTSHLKITLPRGYEIHGRVIDPQGNPVEAAEVRNNTDAKIVFTDADGRFQMPGVRQIPMSMTFTRLDFGATATSGQVSADQTITLTRRPTTPARAPASAPRAARAVAR